MKIRDCIVSESQIKSFLRSIFNIDDDHLQYKILTNRLGAFQVLIVMNVEEVERNSLLIKLEQQLKETYNITNALREESEIMRPLAQIDIYTYEEAKDDIYIQNLITSEHKLETRRSLHSWFDTANYETEQTTGSQKPAIVSFYSYKGGVGRSTTLAYVAMHLANQGETVVVVDCDLEAPGLHSIFGVTPQYGVVDYLIQRSFLSDESAQKLIRSGVNRVQTTKGKLYVLPATKVVDKKYIEKLSHIDFGSYKVMKKNKKVSVFDKLFIDLQKTFGASVILVDSRTGFAEMGGALLMDYSDEVCFVLTGNEQNLDGLNTISQHLIDQKQDDNPMPNFVWVHNRIPMDGNEESDDSYKMQVRTEVEKMYSKIYSSLGDEREDTVFQYEEIPRYPQLERFIPDLLHDAVISSEFSKVASSFRSVQTERSTLESQIKTREILSELADIGTGKAESDFSNEEKIKLNFYESRGLRDLMAQEKFFILGEKGTGKTSLFLVLNQKKDQNQLFLDVYSEKSEYKGDFFVDLNKHLEGTEDGERQYIWKRFWLYFLVYRLLKQGVKPPAELALTRDLVEMFSKFKVANIADWMKDFSKGKEVQNLLREWDRSLVLSNRNIFAIYDNLDKYLDVNSELRRFCNAGLVRLWEDLRIDLSSIYAKVFFRSDIYSDIREMLENRTHLDEFTLDIRWNRTAIIGMLVKRLLSRSDRLRNYIQKQWQEKGDPSLNLWGEHPNYGIQPFESESTLNFMFNEIFGERMDNNKKSGYALNWLIDRLSDAKGDLFPRELIVMIRKFFLQIEQVGEERFSIYSGLIPLAAVGRNERIELMTVAAEERLSDLKEEYPQIGTLIHVLENSGLQFPVTAGLLKQKLLDDDIDFLVERGFLDRRIDREQLVTYKIPHLYVRATKITQIGR